MAPLDEYDGVPDPETYERRQPPSWLAGSIAGLLALALLALWGVGTWIFS